LSAALAPDADAADATCATATATATDAPQAPKLQAAAGLRSSAELPPLHCADRSPGCGRAAAAAAATGDREGVVPAVGLLCGSPQPGAPEAAGAQAEEPGWSEALGEEQPEEDCDPPLCLPDGEGAGLGRVREGSAFR